MSNPFFDLQGRLAGLLRADAYFAPLADDAILTEIVGDIDNRVTTDLLPLGFGVVITTAKGEGSGTLSALRSRETLTVALISNPTLDPDHAVLDALAAAIRAIHGQPALATTAVRKEEDCWRVVSHERRTDAPPELHVHHLLVQVTVSLA